MYDKTFYAAQSGDSFSSAKVVVPHLVERFNPKSVCDVGCGIGTWLKAFKDIGVTDVTGFDGAYVDATMLKIERDEFFSVDLEREDYPSQRTYDVCISLEVGEHLTYTRSDSFISWLCKLSNIVVFSAAVPGQGGTYHINEQKQSYWASKFAAHGFEPMDAVRPLIWDCSDVCWWYKQNMVVYVKNGESTCSPKFVLDILHPEFLVQKLATTNGFGNHLRELIPSAVKAISNRF
jgi:hypothetical protein